MPLPNIDSLWDYYRPDLTEERFREVLPQARAAGDPAYLAELLTQIARTYSLRGRFDEAHEILDEVQGLLAEGPNRARVRYLLERGRCFNSAGEPDRARPLFLQAWEDGLAAHEDLLAVDAAHMVAIVESPEGALDWNQRALDLAQGSDQPGVAERWLASLYNNMGWTYHDRGEYEQALQCFGKALTWREKRGQPRETRFARWAVARALRSLGRYTEALTLQQQNLRENEEFGEPDPYVDEELGECLLALGNEDTAREHFRRAYAGLAADEWLQKNEPERLARLEELGGASS